MKAVRSPGLWRHCAPRTHQRGKDYYRQSLETRRVPVVLTCTRLLLLPGPPSGSSRRQVSCRAASRYESGNARCRCRSRPRIAYRLSDADPVNTDQSESQEWAPARPDRYFGLGKATRLKLDNLDRIRWLRYHRFRPPMTQYYSHMNTVVSCEQFWEPLGRAISAKIGTLLPHRRSGRRARFRLSRGVESSRPPASTFALPKSRE